MNRVRRFAEQTKVPIARSKAAVEQLLAKRQASEFGTYTDPKGSHVSFRVEGLFVRISVPMPDGDEREARRRWRSILLALKAKFDAVDSEISTLEQEFMAHIVVADGQTVGEHLLPRLAAALTAGKMPRLTLPLPEDGDA